MVLSRCRREGVCSPWKVRARHLSPCSRDLRSDSPPPPPFASPICCWGRGMGPWFQVNAHATSHFQKWPLLTRLTSKLIYTNQFGNHAQQLKVKHSGGQGSRESVQRGRLDTTGSSKMAPGDSWWEAICLLVLHVLRRSVGRNECQDSHVLFLDAFRFCFVFKIIPEPL